VLKNSSDLQEPTSLNQGDALLNVATLDFAKSRANNQMQQPPLTREGCADIGSSFKALVRLTLNHQSGIGRSEVVIADKNRGRIYQPLSPIVADGIQSRLIAKQSEVCSIPSFRLVGPSSQVYLLQRTALVVNL
jgi:hypothetical protein